MISKKGITVLLFAIGILITGYLLYPIVRGNTRVQYDSIYQTELTEPIITQVRGKKYHEIIAVYRYFNKLKAAVFYSQHFTDDKDFERIDRDEVKDELNAFAVIKNGPRYWVIDEITAYYLGEEKNIAGFSFIQPATVELTIGYIRSSAPYTENKVSRRTEFTVKAGEKVYELVSGDNLVYTMQSASLEIDNKLSFADLDNLGSRLNLPEGWEYRVRILDEDTSFYIEEFAIVLQDEYNNTYQRNPGQ